MAGNVYNGFPFSPGSSKTISAIQHYGPSSYTQVTRAPTAGGDTLNASEFGLKWIDAILSISLSDDALYEVLWANPVNPGDGVTPVPVTSVVLEWLTLAGSTEVAALTNLSARSVVIVAIGM